MSQYALEMELAAQDRALADYSKEVADLRAQLAAGRAREEGLRVSLTQLRTALLAGEELYAPDLLGQLVRRYGPHEYLVDVFRCLDARALAARQTQEGTK